MSTVADAVIVGGGPAGATCARALTRAGMDVLLLDRKPFPRDKVCAGWITPAVLATLDIDPGDYARERVIQPIRAFRTGMIEGPAVVNRYNEVVSYGIRRFEFDDYLLGRCGARLALGENLDTLERVPNGWLINGRIRTPLLIGAGGHYCPVARHLGADLGRNEHPVTAQEVEFALSPEQQARCAVGEDTPELYFTPDLKGYGWCFRKGDWLNVGLGREAGGNLGRDLSEFVAWLKSEGRIPQDIPTHFHGHAYLLHRRPSPRPRYTERALLIGDAAGLAYAQSGEGIRPAVESALLAAETIIEAQGDYRPVRLRDYEERLRARLGPGQRLGLPLPRSWRRALGQWVLGSPVLTRRLVLDRWFLHRHVPALRPA
ncbi:MAG: NAD(P)/FAD-dependent oxidoreductase [Thiohalomonadaceae bacterium]